MLVENSLAVLSNVLVVLVPALTVVVVLNRKPMLVCGTPEARNLFLSCTDTLRVRVVLLVPVQLVDVVLNLDPGTTDVTLRRFLNTSSLTAVTPPPKLVLSIW